MIYFIKDSLSGLIKIGHSHNPRARLSQVQVHCAGEVSLVAVEPGDEPRERQLHEQFKADRARGEWFQSSDALNAYIAALPPLAPHRSVTRTFWGGMSAKEVAAASGTSAAMISHIRTGRRRPSAELAIKLQDVTGRSAIEMVFGALADRAA